ncbi:MAG: hypothetical protein HRU19_20820 [Pseudobacteriovorax sp.]|nr:hypothetical protein [Pseudobacteriovorax sp.]
MTLSMKAIRESFAKAQASEDNVAEIIFSKLLADHPELKTSFSSTDMAKQEKLLMNSLEFIVSNLDNVEKLAEYLQNLGERHVAYGVTEEHFPWFGDALFYGFKMVLGDLWDDSLNSNWESFFRHVHDLMKQGMRTVACAVPPAKPLTSVLSEMEADEQSETEVANTEGADGSEQNHGSQSSPEDAAKAEDSSQENDAEVAAEAAVEADTASESTAQVSEDEQPTTVTPPDNLRQLNSKIEGEILMALPQDVKDQIRTVVKEQLNQLLRDETAKIVAEELNNLTSDEIARVIKQSQAA